MQMQDYAANSTKESTLHTQRMRATHYILSSQLRFSCMKINFFRSSWNGHPYVSVRHDTVINDSQVSLTATKEGIVVNRVQAFQRSCSCRIICPYFGQRRSNECLAVGFVLFISDAQSNNWRSNKPVTVEVHVPSCREPECTLLYSGIATRFPWQ